RDESTIRSARPHPAAERRLESELCIRLAACRAVVGQLERALHRLPEGRPLEPECVRTSDLAPELRLGRRFGLEIDRLMQQSDALVEVVARNGELACAAQPRGRQPHQALPLGGRGRDVYFAGSASEPETAVRGNELWTSDGTLSGTR